MLATIGRHSGQVGRPAHNSVTPSTQQVVLRDFNHRSFWKAVRAGMSVVNVDYRCSWLVDANGRLNSRTTVP
jgi:hypothetical protein